MIVIFTPCSAPPSALLSEVAARGAENINAWMRTYAAETCGASWHRWDWTSCGVVTKHGDGFSVRCVPFTLGAEWSGRVARVGVTSWSSLRDPGFDDLGFDQVVGEVPLGQVRRGETQGAC